MARTEVFSAASPETLTHDVTEGTEKSRQRSHKHLAANSFPERRDSPQPIFKNQHAQTVGRTDAGDRKEEGRWFSVAGIASCLRLFSATPYLYASALNPFLVCVFDTMHGQDQRSKPQHCGKPGCQRCRDVFYDAMAIRYVRPFSGAKKSPDTF